jgi:hypothetical protein
MQAAACSLSAGEHHLLKVCIEINRCTSAPFALGLSIKQRQQCNCQYLRSEVQQQQQQQHSSSVDSAHNNYLLGSAADSTVLC